MNSPRPSDVSETPSEVPSYKSLKHRCQPSPGTVRKHCAKAKPRLPGPEDVDRGEKPRISPDSSEPSEHDVLLYNVEKLLNAALNNFRQQLAHEVQEALMAGSENQKQLISQLEKHATEMRGLRVDLGNVQTRLESIDAEVRSQGSCHSLDTVVSVYGTPCDELRPTLLNKPKRSSKLHAGKAKGVNTLRLPKSGGCGVGGSTPQAQFIPPSHPSEKQSYPQLHPHSQPQPQAAIRIQETENEAKRRMKGISTSDSFQPTRGLSRSLDSGRHACQRAPSMTSNPPELLALLDFLGEDRMVKPSSPRQERAMKARSDGCVLLESRKEAQSCFSATPGGQSRQSRLKAFRSAYVEHPEPIGMYDLTRCNPAVAALVENMGPADKDDENLFQNSPEVRLAPQKKIAYFILRIVLTPAFDYFMCIVLTVSTISIFAQVEFVRRDSDDSLQVSFLAVDGVFCAIFVVELMVRMWILGKRNFFIGRDRYVNCFDFLIVVGQVAELILRALGNAKLVSGTSVDAVKALSFLRLFRSLRVFRIVRFVNELNNVVYLIIGSTMSFVWTCFTMMLLTVMVAVFFTQTTRDYAQVLDEEQASILQDYFGSVLLSSVSMFQIVTGGINWKDLSDPMFAINPLLGSVMVGYVSFMILVMFNLVTGVFVDNAQTLRKADLEKAFVGRLRACFDQSLDQSAVRFTMFSVKSDSYHTFSSSGIREIHKEEFFKCLDDPEMQSILAELQIGFEDRDIIFKLLAGDDDSLTCEEFIQSGLRLRHHVLGIDVAKLRLNQMDEFHKVHKSLEDLREALQNR